MIAWLALVLLAATPPSPKIRFERSLPTDSGRVDIAASILPVKNGAVIAGWTSAGGEPADGLLVRIDDKGNVVWRRQLGGARADLLFSVQASDSGGLVCAGFTASRSETGPDGWVVRIDEQGTTISESTFGGDEEDRLTAIRPTPEGWIATGQSSRSGNVDAWVLHLDHAGREVSSSTWGGADVERAIGVEPMPDGGCVLVGRVGDGRDLVDGFVTRLDREGKEVWTHALGGPGFQVAYHLRQHPDGSFVVTGYGWIDEARDHDAQVTKIDADGRVQFTTALGGSQYDRATQSVVLADGSMMTIGYTKRAGADDEDPAWAQVVYGLDAAGRATWTHRFAGEGVQSGRWIAGTADDLWLVGQTTRDDRSRIFVTRLSIKLGRTSSAARSQ
jgi:hypothetical protein